MNLDLHPDIRKLRQFGFASSILLCICAVKAFLQTQQTATWTLAGLAAAAGLCALLKPQFLRPVYGGDPGGMRTGGISSIGIDSLVQRDACKNRFFQIPCLCISAIPSLSLAHFHLLLRYSIFFIII